VPLLSAPGYVLDKNAQAFSDQYHARQLFEQLE
jgi:hypothetical protein